MKNIFSLALLVLTSSVYAESVDMPVIDQESNAQKIPATPEVSNKKETVEAQKAPAQEDYTTKAINFDTWQEVVDNDNKTKEGK